MANIFFLKYELRNTLVCTRDILSTVRTYDRLNYRRKGSRCELILRARQLEKDCLMQLLLQSMQNCRSSIAPDSSVARKTLKGVALRLNSVTFISEVKSVEMKSK